MVPISIKNRDGHMVMLENAGPHQRGFFWVSFINSSLTYQIEEASTVSSVHQVLNILVRRTQCILFQKIPKIANVQDYLVGSFSKTTNPLSKDLWGWVNMNQWPEPEQCLHFLPGKEKFLREWNKRPPSVSQFSDEFFVYMLWGK